MRVKPRAEVLRIYKISRNYLLIINIYHCVTDWVNDLVIMNAQSKLYVLKTSFRVQRSIKKGISQNSSLRENDVSEIARVSIKLQ